ncbi:MAG: sensor signal transduction histidine kinase [Planctomycetaceae bacterium]|nr:sensor signal transduction histidine kinase [Planctomycetaceae bacterium]
MRNWFKNLKVSQKLFLISIFFVMPDSLMLYLFITGINENIHFAEMEKKGTEYQTPLEELLMLIPQHSLLVNGTAPGSPPDKKEFTRLQSAIDKAFTSLEAVNARIGADLQFTDEGLAKRKREHYRVETVKQEWQDLRASLARLTPQDRAARHQHLVADVRMMITHAGDLSNLILDPDLDSYYLMDATLLALPQMQDRLARVMEDGNAMLQRPTLSIPERQELTIYATMLKEVDLDRITASLKTALNEDPNFYEISPSLHKRIPSAIKEFETASATFIRMTSNVAGSEQKTVTAAEFLQAGSEARMASFKLWRVAEEELDRLLRTRISSFQRRRAGSLLVTALALLAAAGFVTFISKSISIPLQRQAEELQRANVGLKAEIAERQRAELALNKAHEELLETSRLAGMAEIATNVLHNVGNVLNSVNVSATLVAERVTKSKSSGLARVVTMLKDHEADLGQFITTDSRGKHLPAYLAQLSEHLAAEQEATVDELESLEKNIEHIKEIVAMQQSYAKVSGVSEIVNVVDLVEDSLRMNSGALTRHGVDVIREYEDVPQVNIDKHKFLQIMVNLIRNAKYACDESGLPGKYMTLKVAHCDGGVLISIIDNGVGIPPENMTRIFNHGFTTRESGHGFGLHSGALAAKEMGGSLTAFSNGLGHGATFTLELPAVCLEEIHV